MDIRGFLRETFQIRNGKLLDALAAQAMTRTVKRKQYLFRSGEQQTHLNILISGVYRISLTDKEGKEITDRFMAVPGQLINTEPVTALCGGAAHALADGEILRIPVDAAAELMPAYPELAVLYNRILRENSLFYRKQLLMARHMSASERYRRFAEEEPAACAAANAGQIASYLGVTRETISRLRKRTENETDE